jgi:hypothetical protein
MTKDEALDLALEFVEANHFGGQDAFELITAIKQARSAPVQEKWGASAVMKPDYVAAQKEKSQQALDVMAENARELGLDYEPVPENFIDALKFDVAMRDAAPVQEPVAIYQYQLANGSWIDQDKFSYEYNVRLSQATVRIVYTTPPAAQRQCEGCDKIAKP